MVVTLPAAIEPPRYSHVLRSADASRLYQHPGNVPRRVSALEPSARGRADPGAIRKSGTMRTGLAPMVLRVVAADGAGRGG